MKWTNYHQHSKYDDGRETIEAHVKVAIDKGVGSMGFSGHCPVPFENNWAMKTEDMSQYLLDISDAKDKYKAQIQVYSGLEVDYIPGVLGPTDEWIKQLQLDYTIGSVHFAGQFDDGSYGEVDNTHAKFLHALETIYKNDIKAFVSEYYGLTRKMVREAPPNIVGHLDKIKMQNHELWDPNAKWYKNELLNTLEVIKAAGLIVEVNTRGIYKKKVSETYPSQWVLGEIQKMKIPIQINSDAHIPNEVMAEFEGTLQLLHQIGFKKATILHQKCWIEADIYPAGLHW